MEALTPESVTIAERTKVEGYYGVSRIVDINGRLFYGAQVHWNQLPTLRRTEREAAKLVDILLIKQGKPPVNILKAVGRRSVEN